MQSLFNGYILLGISPPPILRILLAFLIVALIGFALCYLHRYFIFVVLPVFLWLAYYLVTDLWFFASPSSGYMMFVYLMVLIDFLAIIFGAVLSWKKHKSSFSKLA